MVKSPLWRVHDGGFALLRTVALCLILSVLGFAQQTQAPQGISARETYVTHKAFHAVGGIMIYWAFEELGYPKTGVVMAWLAGIAKEWFDKNRGGSFRGGDIAWTGAPATVVFSFSVKW